MKRLTTEPRIDYDSIIESDGLHFHENYWRESAYYHFSKEEIVILEKATNNLCQISFELIDYVIKKNLFDKLKIPPKIIPHIIESWEKDEKTLYGRYDLAFDGINPPKMLEYNADTPTSLLEAAVVQWNWLQDKFPAADQFNSIHEALTEQIKSFRLKDLHFTYCKENLEDFTLVNYLSSICNDLNIKNKIIPLESINRTDREYYLDEEYQRIKTIFKLYPYEWMICEHDFYNKKTKWIEPLWKMILSNKASLPIMWEMFPDHENLLPAFFEEGNLKSYVKKPIFAREGANISVFEDGKLLTSSEDYGYAKDGFIYQELCKLPDFHGSYPVIGSWIVGETSCGIGIREENGLITSNMARFVPHLIS